MVSDKPLPVKILITSFEERGNVIFEVEWVVTPGENFWTTVYLTRRNLPHEAQKCIFLKRKKKGVWA